MKKRKSKYDWGSIQNYYDAGHNRKDIINKFGICTQVLSWAKKEGKWNEHRFHYNRTDLHVDWKEVQKYYDEMHTWRDVQLKFGFAGGHALRRAIKRGDFKPRTKSAAIYLRASIFGWPKLTDATKKKISEARLRYLEKHPDKVPYMMHHSSLESYPERVFKNALLSAGIHGWTQFYRAGIYEYDFAFTKKKIDVEIDGGTHLQENVKHIDERRDKWTQSQGWTVARFSAKRVRNDVVSCINELKIILN